MMSVLKQLMMPIRRWWLGVVMVLGVAGVVSILPACSFLSSPKTIYVNQTILQSATNKKWDEIAKVMKDNGLTAEQVRTRYSKGHPVREWFLPSGRRNEPLDIRNMALAALLARPINWAQLATAPGTAAPTTAPKVAARPVRFKVGASLR